MRAAATRRAGTGRAFDRSRIDGWRAAAAQRTYDSIQVKSTQSPDMYALEFNP